MTGRYDGLDLFRGFSMFSIVLLHMHKLSGGSPADLVLRVRDFGFPVLIMGSFFVIAVSYDARPTRPFGTIVKARVMRLLVPSLIWSYLYWTAWWVVRPAILGIPAVLPPLSVALTAYMHLWFLHMVFAVTVAMAPVLAWVARGELSRWPVFAACAAAALVCAVWIEPALLAFPAPVDGNPVTFAAPDVPEVISHVAPFLAYVPAGIAFGLARGPIDRWHQSAGFRHGTLIAALAAFAVHVSTQHVPLSREIFAITVFLAILRPLAQRPYTILRGLARWSFVIYILHFAVVILLTAVLTWAGIPRTALTSVIGSLIAVAFSLAAGVTLRRLLPFDWLLPLVSVTESRAADKSVA